MISRSMKRNVRPMRNLDSMALKGSEVCGVRVFLLKAATLRKVFSMVVGPFVVRPVQGCLIKFVQLGNPVHQPDRGADGNVAVKLNQRANRIRRSVAAMNKDWNAPME